MVMKVPVDELIEAIGRHDARGFHAQEVLCVALSRGWIFSEHLEWPEVDAPKCRNERCFDGRVEEWLLGDPIEVECRECKGTGKWTFDPKVRTIEDLTRTWNGVLVGTTAQGNLHAVAWCSKVQKCLDPVGTMYGLEHFNVHSFYLAVNYRPELTIGIG